jgi:hypothetical protein
MQPPSRRSPSPADDVPTASAPEDGGAARADTIDVGELLERLGRGLPQIVGGLLLGVAIAASLGLAITQLRPVTTQTRIVFSFPGFERGEYPDKAKFQPEDVASPAIVAEAIRRTNLPATSSFQTQIRGALNVEGIIPASIVKERDRLRAAGQPLPRFIPDEYTVSLTLPRTAGLSDLQRQHLLNEIITVYRENFAKTYGQAPSAFGTAFETLRSADFPEYELIFNTEMEQIRGYLTQQLEMAKSYRSPTTNMSFQDLLEQSSLFAQIQLNEVLGLIHENGLSRNRLTAKMKMNYYLRQLEERETQAMEEEKVVRGLLEQAQARAQNVVLGVKAQAGQARAETPVVDQTLIDSILQNDAYNLLVRKTLEAGMKMKEIQAQKNRLLDLRDNLISFIQSDKTDQSAASAQVERSIKTLEANYNKLVDNIRRTQADYAKQQYADAVRISDSIATPGVLKPTAVAGVVGGFIGLAFGAGLALLDITIGRRSRAVAA